jgi:hypothetical protein
MLPHKCRGSSAVLRSMFFIYFSLVSEVVYLGLLSIMNPLENYIVYI